MLLTDVQYQDRINTIKTIRISLLGDPNKSSLALVSAKLAEMQTQRDIVSSLLIEALQNKASARLMLESKKTELDMQIANLLATDMEVKSQKTVELRSSLASTKAAGLEFAKHQAELDFIKADSYSSIIHQVQGNIEGAFTSLSTQIDLIKLGYDLGVFPIENLGK